MKKLCVIITLLCGANLLLADSPFQRELKQLHEQHEKAVAAAVDPVNRRHQAALEQLLRRATQSNDLQTAVQIQEALAALGVVQGMDAGSVIGKWTFRPASRPPVDRELKPDGTVTKEGGGTGTWKIEGNTLKIRYPDGSTDFKLPVRNGKLIGRGHSGDKIIAERK
ncbi:hypothetical protein FEM03_14625 [Phragmitibacter flavus]|uniref:Uncharacterized protein n=1 Tax=Phragmitibacter flavus TaxID=2576071 RepID=A0A5R8KCB4_9BACT|nr:hypothetical protein [Phragmitibacter flavus]TLD69963.1 hypothetical protein FEM03_14625 [Phragmitibacter flavus]